MSLVALHVSRGRATMNEEEWRRILHAHSLLRGTDTTRSAALIFADANIFGAPTAITHILSQSNALPPCYCILDLGTNVNRGLLVYNHLVRAALHAMTAAGKIQGLYLLSYFSTAVLE